MTCRTGKQTGVPRIATGILAIALASQAWAGTTGQASIQQAQATNAGTRALAPSGEAARTSTRDPSHQGITNASAPAGSNATQTAAGPAPLAYTILPEIVVAAARQEGDPITLPQSYTVVSREEIKEKQPNEPVEAVKDAPNVFVQQTGAGGGTPIVRGLMGNQVLYLVDGIRINNGRSFSGPSPLFNQVDVGSIDKIEILRGPGSVQYGSDALGGILNIRTKELNIFPSKMTLGGEVEGHFSTVDRALYMHTEGYMAGSNANALAGLTYVNANDYRGGNGEGTLHNTSYSTRGAMAKVKGKLSDNDILSFDFLGDIRKDVERYDQSQRNPSGIPKFFTPDEERYFLTLRNRTEEAADYLSQLDVYAYAEPYYHESRTTSESASKITQTATDSQENSYGVGIQAVTPLFESLTLTYGGDARYETLSDKVTEYATDKATGKTRSSTPKGTMPDGTYDVVDAFAMADWTPFERMRLSTGSRFESTHLCSDPSANNATDGFTVDDLKMNERWNAFTYSLGGTYWVFDGLALASDVATGFRAPNYGDVLGFGAFTYGVEVPSTDVSPEKSLTWEIGPRLETKRLSAQCTFFQTYLRDMITSEPIGGYVDLNGNGAEDAGESKYSSRNADSGWLHGIEFSGTSRLTDQLSLFGDCTWTESRNEDADEPLPKTPPLFGKSGIRFQLAPGSWWVEGFARMVACNDSITQADKKDPARATEPARAFPAADNPPLRPDYSIPGYATFHVRVGVPIKKWCTAYLSGDNLANKEYRVPYNRQDAPGIGFTIGASASF